MFIWPRYEISYYMLNLTAYPTNWQKSAIFHFNWVFAYILCIDTKVRSVDLLLH